MSIRHRCLASTTLMQVALLTLLALSGCVSQKEHEATASELEATKAKLTETQLALDALKVESQRLRDENHFLSNREENVFARAGQLRDDGKVEEAARAYEQFLRDFPTSGRAQRAKEQISALSEELQQRLAEQKRQQLLADQERERRRIAEGLRAGGLSLSEYRTALSGKSGEQVRQLMGTPDSVMGNYWFYTKRLRDTSGLTVDLQVEIGRFGARVMAGSS